MIKKYDDFIGEGFLSKTINRSKSGDLRHEDGKKVMTSLGVEIIIQNSQCDYNGIIKKICNESNIYCQLYESKIYFGDKKEKFQNDELPYDYWLDNKHGIRFSRYEDLIRKEKNFLSDTSLEDYVSILRCIVEVLRKTRFEIDFHQLKFVLMNESEIAKSNQELKRLDELEYGEYIFDDYKDTMYDKKCKGKYVYIENKNKKIYINFSYFTLLNYDKILKYTHKFFKIGK